MTPDNSVSWEKQPYRNGVLLVAPHAPQTVQDYIGWLIAQQPGYRLPEQAQHLDSGSFGTVYQVGSLAIKHFNADSFTSNAGGHSPIAAAKANVTISHGLSRVKNTIEVKRPSKLGTITHTVRAPQYYAVYRSGTSGGLLMSKEDGVVEAPDIQIEDAYRTILDEAVAACGANRSEIFFDMAVPKNNLKLTSRDWLGRTSVQHTKLDAYVQRTYSNPFWLEI